MLKSSEKGFTLVEIAIAVAILGLAFTTLISLHTKMLNSYGIEKNRNQAAMIGQYIFTMLEVAPAPPEVGADNGNLKSKLQDLGYFDTDNEKWKSDDIDDWQFTQTVVSEGLLDIQDVYRRIELKISWGNGSEDSFDLIYFVFTKSY